MALEILSWLIITHALVDFPLQGDFLARAKNHQAPIPGVPWQVCLAAHAVICGGAVLGVLTTFGVFQPGAIAFMEVLVHGATDWAKNEGYLGHGGKGFVVDQAIHIGCKVVWVALVVLSGR